MEKTFTYVFKINNLNKIQSHYFLHQTHCAKKYFSKKMTIVWLSIILEHTMLSMKETCYLWFVADAQVYLIYNIQQLCGH